MAFVFADGHESKWSYFIIDREPSFSLSPEEICHVWSEIDNEEEAVVHAAGVA